MTQKSVSIRANVSIRGVTIRAYALYHNIFYYTIYIFVEKCDCEGKRGHGGDGKNMFFGDKGPEKGGEKFTDEQLQEMMKMDLTSSFENITKCMEGLEQAKDEEWEMIDEWAEKLRSTFYSKIKFRRKFGF